MDCADSGAGDGIGVGLMMSPAIAPGIVTLYIVRGTDASRSNAHARER